MTLSPSRSRTRIFTILAGTGGWAVVVAIAACSSSNNPKTPSADAAAGDDATVVEPVRDAATGTDSASDAASVKDATTSIDASIVDAGSDAPNCGALTLCKGACVNVASDSTNCGTCGTVCVASANASVKCSASKCVRDACNAGFLDCNMGDVDGCEVNGNTDAKNCGACGTVCKFGESCSAGACSMVLSDGLLGYWNMDDAPGAAGAADSSPNGLTAAVAGNVVFVPGAGRKGSGAAMFDGSGALRARFPNNVRGDGVGTLVIPQGDVTFAMWFKTAAAGQDLNGLQVVANGDGSCDRVIGNGPGAGGKLNYNMWSEVNASGTIDVNDGNWHHLVYVTDTAVGQVTYIDGVLEQTSAAPTDNCGIGCSGFNWALGYTIGSAENCRYGAGNFVGMIDEVRMYKKVLSVADVTKLYTGTL